MADRSLNVLATRNAWGRGSKQLVFEGTLEDFHRVFFKCNKFCYAQLERRHDYIQWLFPSPERSRFNMVSCSTDTTWAAQLTHDNMGCSTDTKRARALATAQLTRAPRAPRGPQEAAPLAEQEAEAIRADPAARARLQKSYDMILDFWGFQLLDVESGDVRRATAAIVAACLLAPPQAAPRWRGRVRHRPQSRWID